MTTQCLTYGHARDVADGQEVDCVHVWKDLGRDLLDCGVHFLSEQVLDALGALNPQHFACNMG